MRRKQKSNRKNASLKTGTMTALLAEIGLVFVFTDVEAFLVMKGIAAENKAPFISAVSLFLSVAVGCMIGTGISGRSYKINLAVGLLTLIVLAAIGILLLDKGMMELWRCGVIVTLACVMSYFSGGIHFHKNRKRKHYSR